MALSDLSQRVLQNNQTTQNRPPVNMFDFQRQAQPEDKRLTRDEAKAALANVPNLDAGVQKLISQGYIIE